MAFLLPFSKATVKRTQGCLSKSNIDLHPFLEAPDVSDRTMRVHQRKLVEITCLAAS